jgi:hypothetical protein
LDTKKKIMVYSCAVNLTFKALFKAWTAPSDNPYVISVISVMWCAILFLSIYGRHAQDDDEPAQKDVGRLQGAA